jgi:transposase
MTIVEDTRAITCGVDTHADMHVAAALNPVGGLLGVEEFPATTAGYARLLGWLGGFGTVCLVGIEGTGSYGAGLARHVTAAGIRVVEVDRSDRQDRRRQGKSDPLDAVSAARAAQSGRARGAPKGRDGAVEAIQALMVAKRSARSGRTQAINQARALVLTGPDELRARFARHTAAGLVAALASLRPRPGDVVAYATRTVLRNWDGARSSSTASSRASTSSSCPWCPPALPACSPCTASARHRRPAPDRGRGPPAPATLRGGLGALVRGRPDPGILRQARPPPPQSRGQPRG